VPAQAQEQDPTVRAEGDGKRVTPGRRARRGFAIDVHVTIVPRIREYGSVTRATSTLTSLVALLA